MTDAPASSSGPLVVRVGVTGHRSFDGGDALRERVIVVLEAVTTAVEAIAASRGLDGRVGVVSSLADGADQLVAGAGRELGLLLDCPLPFSRDEYRKDCSEATRETFDTLLGHADNVLELDCPRDQAARAYELAGRVMLEHVDVLLAIWDGEDVRGRGGTAQIVDEARRAGIPIAWIDPAAPSVARLLVDAEDAAPFDPDRLRRAIETIVDPTRGSNADHGRVYMDETLPGWHPTRLLAGAWAAGFSLIAGSGSRSAGDPSSHPQPDRVATYRREYERADGLASFFTKLYRGSFLANYVLAAMAVTCAVLTLVFERQAALRAVEHDTHHGPGAMLIALAVLEFVLVGVIIIITIAANRCRWHERSIDYRYLAEQFRQMLHLGPIGHTTPDSRPQVHNAGGDPRGTWMATYFRRIVRRVGLPDVRHDAASVQALHDWVRDEAIRGQARYHLATAKRMHGFHHRMHVVGIGLFTLTGIAIVLHLAALPFPELHHHLGWTVILTSLLPTWGAALLAITNHGEFERMEKRSHAMHEYLERVDRDLESAATDRPLSSLDLSAAAVPVARAAMDEVADWRMVFSIRPIRPPA